MTIKIDAGITEYDGDLFTNFFEKYNTPEARKRREEEMKLADEIIHTATGREVSDLKNDMMFSCLRTSESLYRNYANTIKNHPEYQFDVYGYNKEVYYLIRPHGVNKAEPIRFLQNDIGITREYVYTVGDNTNDRELISEYNGYRIGDNKDLIDVALDKYDSVHQLINDINKGKVKKRW